MTTAILAEELRADLKKKLKSSKILSVHIPGTGGKATDPFPTYVALEQLKKKNDGIPLIALEGAGSIETTPPNIAYRRKRSLGAWISHSIGTAAKFDAEKTNNLISDVISLTKPGAMGAGTVLGAGEHQNNELILNFLKELDTSKSDKLPAEIVLSGHSRGAINAIYLANEIYAKYGDKIKLHLVLTDLVPGPFHEIEWKKRVIPPNVATFSAFYAQNHENLFFIPHDLSRLTFCSPNTVVTTYSTLDDHQSITNNIKVTVACHDMMAGIYGFDNDLNSDDIKRFKKDIHFFNAYTNKTDIEIQDKMDEDINKFDLIKIKEDNLIKGYIDRKENSLINDYINISKKNDGTFQALSEREKVKRAIDKIDYFNLYDQEKVKDAKDNIGYFQLNDDEKKANVYQELQTQIIRMRQYPTDSMHSKEVFARRNCQYVAKTSLQPLTEQIDQLELKSNELTDAEQTELARLQQLKKNIEAMRKDFDTHPDVELAPPYQRQSEPNPDTVNTEAKRLSYLHSAHSQGSGKYNISSNEFVAYLLILPTLGLSATIFKTMENYDHKFGMLLLGVLTLNLATAITLATQINYKLGSNLYHSGFFRPGFTPKEIARPEKDIIEKNKNNEHEEEMNSNEIKIQLKSPNR